MSEQQDSTNSRVSAALRNIRIDAAIVEVVENLSAVGIDSLVLKGPALEELYAGDPHRSYLDGDIWVAPQDLGEAAQTLERLGFMPYIDESGLPDWWLDHASSWHRVADHAAMDLHRNLQGMRADPAHVWARLWSERQSFSVRGHSLYRLSDPARMLYVVLHAAHDGPSGKRAMIHLQRALALTGPETWEQAAELAREFDAIDAFGAGLRLQPAGVELAERLQIPLNTSVDAALKAASPPPVALGFEQLASAPGWADRSRILLLKAFPPPGFVRHWWPPAARSPWMLAVGYSYRPFWLLKRAPAGWRAWRAARRSLH